MTDLEYVTTVFHVDKETAEKMIVNGMNVDYLRNGFADDLSKHINNMKGSFIQSLKNVTE